MTIDALGRPDWLIENLRKVPSVIGYLRSTLVPSIQARNEGRVSGSPDVARPPLNVAAFDDADELWSSLCALVVEHAARTREPLPAVIGRQWLDRSGESPRVRGYASSDPEAIYADTFAITQWLVERAWALALGAHYTEQIDALVDRIRELAGRIPTTVGYRFKAFQVWACPECLHRSVESIWEHDQLARYECEECGWERIVRG